MATSGAEHRPRSAGGESGAGGEAVRRRDGDDLIAAYLGLAVLILMARLMILGGHLKLLWLLPIISYQDLLFVSLLAWAFVFFIRRASTAWARRTARIAGWSLCLLAAAIAGLHVIVFSYILQPVTVQLIEISGNLGGVQGTVSEALSTAGAATVISLLVVIVLAQCWIRLAPHLLARISDAFMSRTAVAVIVVFAIVSHMFISYRLGSMAVAASANPEWALVSSIVRARPIAVDKTPAAFRADFLPFGERATASGAITSVKATTAKPMNVLMVMMESVGAQRLQLTGAPYADSPYLIQLARHGLLFNRMYVSQAMSSSAMAALFCSIYPQHDFFTLTRRNPDLTLPSLPAILDQHGYRSAFIRLGDLEYDNDAEFLRRRGFQQIIDEPRTYDRPMDAELLPAAMKWIKKDPSHPFFLTLWTVDTHNPYPAAVRRDFQVSNRHLNRYLNGILAADDLIAQLAAALERNGLADNTLLVIGGDHGEAFGEHGQLAHGFSVYDEEVHIPLLIVNRKMFPQPRVVNSLARQIDIAPTLLDLLGIAEPAQWQGQSLLSGPPPARAYMFASDSDFRFGLIEGNEKYIYNYDSNRSELYDLATDPKERHDLSRDPANAATVAQAHLRIEAWLQFQNRWLAQFVPSETASR
ncbi:MAG: sulfatase-like hydrolase/transferase [Candidatus Binataceae bacterium]